jgi:hypothetical protein
MTASIRRKAEVHTTDVLTWRESEPPRPDETELVNRFESVTAKVLEDYARELPREPRTTDALVFQALYERATATTPGANAADEIEDHTERRQWVQEQAADEEFNRLSSVLAALLAAETEARGPLRLTTAQTVRLAAIVEKLGHALCSQRLPRHAVVAFTRAGALYLDADEQRPRDRCMLACQRARNQALRLGPTKLLGIVGDALCGYGYEPYRLLAWGVVQLAVFSVLFVVAIGSPWVDGVYVALMNYLNPFGIGDLAMAGLDSRPARLLLVLEAYLGLISTSVFFALVVRRWFRL